MTSMKPEQAIVAFDAKNIAVYGNQMLGVIVRHEDAKADAEHALAQADEREKIIDFELTRVALHLHAAEKIDLYNIYADGRDSSTRLYRSILTETGVLQRVVNDDTDKISYDFTDVKLAGKFDFNEDLKEKDETEYKARRSRRNSLNMRLARVSKAALALFEAKATPDNLIIEKDEETGELAAVLTKGPSEVMGKEGKIQVFNKSVAKVEGAKVTPTITGLAKIADSVHKAKTESAAKVESGKKDKTGAAVADLAAILNTALMAVRNREGEFSDSEKTQLKTLLTEIKKYVK